MQLQIGDTVPEGGHAESLEEHLVIALQVAEHNHENGYDVGLLARKEFNDIHVGVCPRAPGTIIALLSEASAFL